MDETKANKYIFYLIISFFIAIYIICLVYLFRKESEIASLILLIIYQTMFMFYLLSKASANSIYKDFIGTIIWNITLISTILNFVSLIMFTMTYYYLYNEYKLDGNKTIPLSKKNTEYIEKFKKFLIVTVTLTLFLIIFNAFDIIAVGIFGKLLLFFLFCVFGTLLGISSYNVFITNEIMKLKDVRVISQ
jgi:hypothetical protein